MKGKIKRELKDAAKEIIAVSLGFIASSLLLAFGIQLCLFNNWIGIFPLIVGYELGRYVFILLIKTKWNEMTRWT